MIKARVKHDQGEFFFLGISEGNIERLKQGKPIRVKLAELGGTDEVIIHYGKTEKEILVELGDLGAFKND